MLHNHNQSSQPIADYSLVIDFWFSNHDKWFAKDPQFDLAITNQFLPLYKEAAESKLDEWQKEPLSMLALIIVLDQFPRNMFRDNPMAYDLDKLAVTLTKKAIKLGFNKELKGNSNYLKFLYMPLMHSENFNNQKLSLKLFGELADKKTCQYARAHYDIILLFHRFPHRNKILNRISTRQKIEFLKNLSISF
jgi:uncharacterized protein (DUF924 family)